MILLPPSESKTGRAIGKPADLGRVSFPELASTRVKVAAALAQISAHPDAPSLLGVSANLRSDIAHNLRLGSAPAVRVADLYTGVLYDALDLASLDSVARRRANRWLVVVSALFGALRPADKIPPYRLSMGVNLGELGPLAAVWRAPLATVLPLAAGRGMDRRCQVEHVCHSLGSAGRPCQPLGADPRPWRHAHGQAHPGSGGPVPVPDRGRRQECESPAAGGCPSLRDNTDRASTARPAVDPQHKRSLTGTTGASLTDLATRIGPVLIFLVAITVVAEIADAAGVFDVAGHSAARAGHGHT